MKNAKSSIFLKGLIFENPVFVLVLGTCPTLATTTTVIGALGMGIAAMFVLICSNAVISLLRKVIPKTVRIPSYIVLIAGFVTIVQMLMQAFLPSIYELLGIYLPLITVNCIILGRAEMFANKNTVLKSVVDAVGMGLGFTVALLLIAVVREVLGQGTFAGLPVPFLRDNPIAFFAKTPGGFMVYGLLIAATAKLTKGKAPKKKSFSCAACPSASICEANKLKGEA